MDVHPVTHTHTYTQTNKHQNSLLYIHIGTPYCDATGAAFEDNVFRYTLLSLAACEAPLCLNMYVCQCTCSTHIIHNNVPPQWGGSAWCLYALLVYVLLVYALLVYALLVYVL